MKRLVGQIDETIALLTDILARLLLIMLTTVVLYAVVMRYIFQNPPFWSDIVVQFGNVGMVFLGLSIAVRSRDLIAMQALYEKIAPRFALLLDALWNLVILAFSIIFTWYGFVAARTVPGFYWELGNLPQSYPMMIVPISGALVFLASVRILIEDIMKYQELGDMPEDKG